MIGEKIVLRMRMSAKDVVYAGNLVNGARMLDVFGDVSTELLIRSDGDEGLFCAYDSVEFLEPVYLGDFMEYYCWMEEMGNTSRKVKWEAYKVIELANDPNLSVSACNVLPEPLLVGRASGTVVVKKEQQRGPQDPKFKR